jgi:hypothetical protein
LKCFFENAGAPATLFLGGQVRLSQGVVKLVAAENSSHADLRSNIGKAGDEHHGDAFHFDLSTDRSAATSAGSSSGGQYDAIHAGGGEVFGDALA